MYLTPSAAGHAPEEDFPLREASQLFAVELSTLRHVVRRGGIAAYKARGPWGREWRVTASALAAKGYTRRPAGDAGVGDAGRVVRLEQELAAARRRVAAERSRAEEADRQLGEALLQAGRLRAALAMAEGDVETDEVLLVDLDGSRGALVDLRASNGPASRL